MTQQSILRLVVNWEVVFTINRLKEVVGLYDHEIVYKTEGSLKIAGNYVQ